MILLFSGMIAGWTMSVPGYAAGEQGTVPVAKGDQLYSIDSIHDWMFMRQSESSIQILGSRIAGFKYVGYSLQLKAAERSIPAMRQGTFAQASEGFIPHLPADHNNYYILYLRKIVI